MVRLRSLLRCRSCKSERKSEKKKEKKSERTENKKMDKAKKENARIQKSAKKETQGRKLGTRWSKLMWAKQWMMEKRGNMSEAIEQKMIDASRMYQSIGVAQVACSTLKFHRVAAW
jgi:hypothetical protein